MCRKALLPLGLLTVCFACLDFNRARQVFCEGNPAPECATAVACANGTQDGTETGVDCGGECPLRCGLSSGCQTNADCESNQCNLLQGVCTTGACADGVMNHQETDVDCGGGGACPACALHLRCALPSDCESDSCDSQQRCEPYVLTWQFGVPRLCGRTTPLAGVLNERLVVAGVSAGCDVSVANPENTVEMLRTTDTAWSDVTSVAYKARTDATLVRSGNYLYVLGGFTESGTTAVKLVSRTNGTDAFIAWTPMNQNRGAFAATSLPDGRIFVAGGHATDISTSVNALSSTEIYTPDPTGMGAGAWTAGPSLGTYRAAAQAAATDDGRIYVMGGVQTYVGRAPLDRVEVFPADGGMPTALSAMPIPRAFFGMVLGPDGRIYLAGGETSGGTYTARVDAYDPRSNTWTRLPDLPEAFTQLVLVVGPDNRVTAIPGKKTPSGEQPRSFYAYGPRFRVGTAPAAPGATVSVDGQDFPASTTVILRFGTQDGPEVATTATTTLGRLPSTLTFQVPEGTPSGVHAVFAEDVKSHYPVRATLTVP